MTKEFYQALEDGDTEQLEKLIAIQQHLELINQEDPENHSKPIVIATVNGYLTIEFCKMGSIDI